MGKTKHKDLIVLKFKTASCWNSWLVKNFAQTESVWLKLAKKKSGIPSISYEEAREFAIIFGWIDGLLNGWDDQYYLIKFSPRRPRSQWSKINRGIAEQLISEGRMQESGLAQVKAAQQDGRWDAAYDSAGTIEPPPEIVRFLKDHPDANSFYESLSSQNRYAFLYRIQTPKREETRTRHIEKMKSMLLAKETYHPHSTSKSIPRKQKTKRVSHSQTTAKNSGKPKMKTAQPLQTDSGRVDAKIRISLLRGINVGGHNKIKMQDLREELVGLHLQDVKTYIQSGNIVYRSSTSVTGLSTQIGSLIASKFALDVPVVTLNQKQLNEAILRCPYPTDQSDKIHYCFLSKKPTKSSWESLKKVELKSEQIELIGKTLYMFMPDGMARTKLTSQLIETKLKVVATARNWKTTQKLKQLAAEL